MLPTITEAIFENYSSYWTDDVIWLPRGAPAINGKAGIVNFAAQGFLNYRLKQEITIDEIQVCEDFGYIRGETTEEYAPLTDQFKPVTISGKGIFLFRKRPIMAVENEDAEMLRYVICDDPKMVFFGTDATERWVERKEFISAQKDFFKATSGSKLEVYNKTIQFSKSGTVAWASCLIDWDIMAGDQPMHLEGLRGTFVFEKRDGNLGNSARPRISTCIGPDGCVLNEIVIQISILKRKTLTIRQIF